MFSNIIFNSTLNAFTIWLKPDAQSLTCRQYTLCRNDTCVRIKVALSVQNNTDIFEIFSNNKSYFTFY